MDSKRKTAIASAGALALLVLLKAAFFSAPKVKEVRLEKRDLTAQVYGNGTVEAKVVVGVSSKLTGRIVELYADQGDRVKRGRLLARLENDDLAGQLRKARATLELASRNARRYRSLADKDLVSRLEAEQYETADRVAAAEEAAARARLDDTLIAAPEDGLIISRHLEKGAIVTPGQAIFSLVDARTVWVKANVDESLLRGVAVGRKAVISLRSAPGAAFPGEVVRVGRESDRVTEELVVDVAFTPPLKDFHLGEQADVLITDETRTNAPSLPSAAVVSRGSSRGVWVIAGKRLEFRPVVAGAEDGRGFTEIVSGLADGDRVALAAPPVLGKLSSGMKVRAAR
ncbi:MAG: efflux RND transporter periplasmic adaptor subunit [Elusimicrobia bacterium]|nr:efflux RND transporter periplasmic adaptor subunit [Elusimicrobiota bacterium]